MAKFKVFWSRVCDGERKPVGENGLFRKRRFAYAAIAVAVFVVGVLSRVVETNSVLFGKYLGDALYAVIFYVCLACAFPVQSIATRAIIVTIFVILVECFQLTGIPLQLRNGNVVKKLISIVLGTKFSWFDMLAYAVGIVAIVSVDVGLISRGNK